MKFAKFLAAAAASTFIAGAASAATCTGPDGTMYTLNPDDALVVGPIDGDPNPSCIAGNDDGSGGFFDDGTLWGITDWIKADKPEDGSGDKTVTFFDAPEIDATSGTWGVNDFDPSKLTVALILKAGSSFSAFLLDGDPLSGTWEISKENSHASLWYVRDDTPVIPLPAAGWMLIAGIGGLAALRRRKKS